MSVHRRSLRGLGPVDASFGPQQRSMLHAVRSFLAVLESCRWQEVQACRAAPAVRK